MPRFVAFLRAINVGGRNVSMEKLREVFGKCGLQKVETFIASGNVIFETRKNDTEPLRKLLDSELEKELGYSADVFLRTDTEVSAIAEYQAFSEQELSGSYALNVGFLQGEMKAVEEEIVQSFKTDIDSFHVHGREIYWLCVKKQSESKFSNALLERRLKQRATWRGINTVRRLSKKYPPAW